MSVSGTTTFSVTRNDIIAASLRLLGVLEEGAVPNATAIENASLVLNMMLKDWMTDGIKLWTVNEIVLPLVNGQTVYTIGPDVSNDLVTNKPLRLIQAFIRNMQVTPHIDIPTYIISEQEYNMLGSKFTTGQVNSCFYKPFVDYGQVKLFLTPDQNIQTNYEFHMTVQRPIFDMNKAGETFDFPSEWYQCLRWGLAAELAADYGLDLNRAALVIQRAEQYKERMMAWDVENASTYFQPDMRSANPKFR